MRNRYSTVKTRDVTCSIKRSARKTEIGKPNVMAKTLTTLVRMSKVIVQSKTLLATESPRSGCLISNTFSRKPGSRSSAGSM